MNIFEEWDAERRRLIDKVMSKKLRLEKLVRSGAELSEVKTASRELDELNAQLVEHEKKAP
ncbi:MAG: hypothetical protein JO270_00125 [Acidobacteriaceae bacterium]|nr:hypothetical protein [Acidobacteriaceae bacterium]